MTVTDALIDAIHTTRSQNQSQWYCHNLWRQAENLAGDDRSRATNGRHAATTRDQGRRPGCDSVPQFRYVSRVSFFRGLGRRRHRTDQYAPRSARSLYWLQDCGAKTLVVAEPFVDVINSIRDQLGQIEQFIFVGDGPAPQGYVSHEDLIANAEPVADAGRSGEDLYALFYTGGTTGRSKGVMINHQGMTVNILEWIAAVRVTQEDRFLVIPPMFHAAGGENSLAVAALGATACILPQFDVVEGFRLIERERVTKVPLVATMLDMMVKHPQLGNFDLSSIKKITYGASPMPVELLETSMDVLPDAQFFQVYGQTEGGPTVTVLPPEYHVTEGPYSGKLKSAGVPIIGVDICITDERGKELDPDETGEICIKGPGVSPGYWNLPELSETAYFGDWLRTGDAGHIDEDGFLFISDRVKDMIITGGENVYPAEVELVLLGHEAVAECAVIGIPSDKWGEQVHGIVRLKQGHSATADELVAWCRDHLAGYKITRSIEFREEPFPLSATAKILKRELRRPYWNETDKLS
nr:feruloyl-CoA synthase-like [Nerophis lumbriciformis]